MNRNPKIERAAAPEGHEPRRVPVVDDCGMVVMDPWWGTIQPQQLHPDLPTYGELELIEHLNAGGAIVDTRRPEYVEATGTIPGSLVIPWEEIERRASEIDPNAVTVLYCNGPQCAATPRAVEKLLAMGRDPRSLAYYRGGIYEWMSLGLPIEAYSRAGSEAAGDLAA